jgi:hypothetical protein
MMMLRTLRTLACGAVLAGFSIVPAFAAQNRPAPARAEAPPPPQVFSDENARDTRERLRELLQQFPPSLARVLELDPSLLSSSDYLATYPKLAAFLAQHPEVTHNPSFFIGQGRVVGPESDRSRAFNLAENVLAGLAMLTVFGTVVGFFAWLSRALLNYRYWLRASKVQTDAHTKLVDRLTSNEDLLAYVQSPAGQRYLASAPISVDVAPRSVGAPVGRILWSVQVGVIMALAGVGLLVAKGTVVDEAAQVLQVIAILAIAVGVGFVLSALVSYLLSQRLGLLDPHPRTDHA